MVTGSVFAIEAFTIPGPLGSAAIGAIVVGLIMILMGMFGYKAARDRKIEGKETKGKCELILYAVIIFSMFALILVLGIMLLVWLGGSLPSTGVEPADEKVDEALGLARRQVDNLVSCSYNLCCGDRAYEPAPAKNTTIASPTLSASSESANTTGFVWRECLLDENGIPDSEKGETVLDVNGTIIETSIKKMDDKICEYMDGNCRLEFEDYRNDVGDKLYAKLEPFAYSIVVLSGLLFIGWLFAVLELFWCCGESDLDENVKVAPENYDDY